MADRTDRLRFLAARGAIVVARPLALVIAARLLGNEAANEFAQAIVAVGFGLIASAFDSGRLYYEATIREGGVRGVAFHRYLGRLAVSGAAGAAVAGVLLWRSGSDATTIAAALAYFATERATDERQRYLLIDARAREWSVMQLWRGGLQVALTAAILAVMASSGRGSVAWLLAGLSAANLLALPSARGLRMAARSARSLGTAARLSTLGASTIRRNWTLWASGLMAATLGFGDRLMVSLWDGPDTASLVVLCSCMNLQSVVVSTLFFTPRRAAIVRRDVPMSAFATRAYLAPAALGLGAAVAFAAASLAAFSGDSRASVAAIAAAGAASVATTLAGMAREVVHYRAPGGSLAVIDGGVLGMASIATLAAWAAGLPVHVGFVVLAAAQSARAAMLCTIAVRHRPIAGTHDTAATEG